MNIAHRMQQRGHLFLPGRDNAWIRMAGSRHAKRGGQVEIPFSFSIPDMNSLGSFPNDWPRPVGLGEQNVPRFVLLQQLNDFARIH